MVAGRPLGSGYVLHERIGSGATGEVWRASRLELGEEVAVKTLRSDLAEDPDLVARFLVERRALVGVRHEHLVHVRDLVAEGETLAIVMDLAPGRDVRRRLDEDGPFSTAESIDLAVQILEGLAAIHAAGIVHRDVKPENVIVDERSSLHARLTDFGIARVADAPTLTRDGVLGTPRYMAPELASAEPVTTAADQYSLGAMLFELVAGRPPFEGTTTFELIDQHARHAVPRLGLVPSDLMLVIERMMAKSASDRFPDVERAAAALRRVRSGLSPEMLTARPPGPLEVSDGATHLAGARQATSFAKRNAAVASPTVDQNSDRPWRRLAVVGAAVVALALAAVLIAVANTNGESDDGPGRSSEAEGAGGEGVVTDTTGASVGGGEEQPEGGSDEGVEPRDSGDADGGEDDVVTDTTGASSGENDQEPDVTEATAPQVVVEGRPIICSSHDGETESPQADRTGFHVAAFCRLEIPSPGKVLLLGSATAVRGDEATEIAAGDHEAVVQLFEDPGPTLEIDEIRGSARTYSLTETDGFLSLSTSATIDVAPGSMNVGLAVRRVSGTTPVLWDPTLVAIFVPAVSDDVRLCSSTADRDFETSNTEFGSDRATLVVECEIDADRPGQVVIVASADVTSSGSTPVTVLASIFDNDSAVSQLAAGQRVETVPAASTPRPLVLVDSRPMSAGEHLVGLFASVGDGEGGSLRLANGSIAALWVADDSEHTSVCASVDRRLVTASTESAVIDRCTAVLDADSRVAGIGTATVRADVDSWAEFRIGLEDRANPDGATTRVASIGPRGDGLGTGDSSVAYGASYALEEGAHTFDLTLRAGSDEVVVENPTLVLVAVETGE